MLTNKKKKKEKKRKEIRHKKRNLSKNVYYVFH